MSILNRLFNLNDVRYNYYYKEIYNGHFIWSRNFSQFPGLEAIFPGERYVMENITEIVVSTNDYWYFSMYISIAYIISIFTVKHIMSKREKGFELKYALIFWNWFLAIFSFTGTLRCWPEFLHILFIKGFFASYTQSTYVEDIRICGWYWLFTMSKAPELIDTLFIVLRKRRLINLHWIHHALTLIYSWFVFGDIPSTARWMVNMNLFVHTFMYTYYAMSTMGYRFPKQINVTLTTLQIVQMLFGFYIHIDCLRLKLTQKPCDVSVAIAIAGFSLYFLFFMLFVNFFIKTYIIPNSKQAVKIAMENGKTILKDLNNNSNGKEVVKKLQ